jgi:hypothetical protein
MSRHPTRPVFLSGDKGKRSSLIATNVSGLFFHLANGVQALFSPDQREIANKALRKGCPRAWRFSSRIAALARRPSGRFADFREIAVHTCLCLKLVGGGAVRGSNPPAESSIPGRSNWPPLHPRLTPPAFHHELQITGFLLLPNHISSRQRGFMRTSRGIAWQT